MRRAEERAPGRSLRAHLAALVLAVLLPSLALGAVTAWHMAANYRAAFEGRLSDTAQALALAVGREVQAHVAALTALAASPLLREDDLAGFYPHARGAAEAISTPIVVIGADLRQRLHTDRPFGSPLPTTNAAEAVRTAMATRRAAVSDLLVGAVLRVPVVAVAVPVLRGGRSDIVLTAPLAPNRITGLLASQGLNGGTFATVMDSRDVIVARSREAATFVGRPAPTWLTEEAAGREAGILRGRTLAGEGVILAFRRLAGLPGWTVVVGEPLAAYDASWRRPLIVLAAGGTVTFLVALAAAAGLGRRILRPVRALAGQAEAVAASGGEAAIREDAPARVLEFEGLRRSIRRADAALREREARLRAVVETASDAIVVTDEAGVIRSFNRAAEVIFGYAEAEAVGRNVSLLVGAEHEGHFGIHMPASERAMGGVGQEVEGHRKDGTAVPLDLAVAEWRDGAGERYFTRIMRDISGRKAEEARRTVLMREVDHRAKNALAVVQAVLRLTRADEPRAYAAAVSARVAALARAHSLLAECGWSGVDLRAIVLREVTPYAPIRQDGCAVSLDGPPVALAPVMVQPLGMVLHELATNAAQHGALSAPSGRVLVQWDEGEDGLLTLRWLEMGGPPVPGAPARRGFGTKLVETAVRGQLGGTVGFRWEPTGLVVEIAVPLGRTVARVEHHMAAARSGAA